ncbi:phosphoglycerate mutase [Marixanthomonas spongiae]|uniref:Phosphoglycerate mutase n=2 Tax=Marixanthomonas spongiae TaxID=2174845 RepID=A0A2U0HXE4_9FLAO|nr:phosphoglycerate mutase [Marixanthomonas spongiae]
MKPPKPETEIPEISTYYFIRHAEKDRSDPNNEDPDLNEDGIARAALWTKVFQNIKFDEIYSTEYKRTQQTVSAISLQSDVKLTPYSADNLYSEDFKMRTQGKTVLVVGHSDTTPQFVNKIIGEDRYPDIDDADNGSLYIVTVVGDKTKVQLLTID